MMRSPAVTAAGPGLHGHQHRETTARTATDPVCGMAVDPATARYRTGYRGRDYVFCGARCLERFAAAPERFLTAAPPAAPEAAAGATWTCPMHPEIVRDAPGACPICGMALEPTIPTAGGEPENPELRDMTRRFWVAAALSVPLLAIAM